MSDPKATKEAQCATNDGEAAITTADSRGRNAGSTRETAAALPKNLVDPALENIVDETNKSKEKRFVITIVELNTDRVLFQPGMNCGLLTRLSTARGEL